MKFTRKEEEIIMKALHYLKDTKFTNELNDKDIEVINDLLQRDFDNCD